MKTSSEMVAVESHGDLRELLTRCRALVDGELDRLVPAATTEPTSTVQFAGASSAGESVFGLPWCL
jgi:hypothetical protein